MDSSVYQHSIDSGTCSGSGTGSVSGCHKATSEPSSDALDDIQSTVDRYRIGCPPASPPFAHSSHYPCRHPPIHPCYSQHPPLARVPAQLTSSIAASGDSNVAISTHSSASSGGRSVSGGGSDLTKASDSQSNPSLAANIPSTDAPVSHSAPLPTNEPPLPFPLQHAALQSTNQSGMHQSFSGGSGSGIASQSDDEMLPRSASSNPFAPVTPPASQTPSHQMKPPPAAVAASATLVGAATDVPTKHCRYRHHSPQHQPYHRSGHLHLHHHYFPPATPPRPTPLSTKGDSTIGGVLHPPLSGYRSMVASMSAADRYGIDYELELRAAPPAIRQKTTGEAAEDFVLFLCRYPLLNSQPRAPHGIGSDRIANERIVIATEDDSVGVAFQRLTDHRYLSMPVVDNNDNGVYKGYIDLMRIAQLVTQEMPMLGIGEPLGEPLLDISPSVIANRMAAVMNSRLVDAKCAAGSSDCKCASYQAIRSGHSLMFAVEILARAGLRRVTVLDDEDRVVGLLTQSMIISLLCQYTERLGPLAEVSVKSLIAQRPLATICADSRAMDAFRLMVQQNVSGLAVVDHIGQLVDTISIRDLRGIGAYGKNALRLWSTVAQYKAACRMDFPNATPPMPIICRLNDTLTKVLSLMDDGNVHRIFIVDDMPSPITAAPSPKLSPLHHQTSASHASPRGVAGGGAGGSASSPIAIPMPPMRDTAVVHHPPGSPSGTRLAAGGYVFGSPLASGRRRSLIGSPPVLSLSPASATISPLTLNRSVSAGSAPSKASTLPSRITPTTTTAATSYVSLHSTNVTSGYGRIRAIGVVSQRDVLLGLLAHSARAH